MFEVIPVVGVKDYSTGKVDLKYYRNKLRDMSEDTKTSFPGHYKHMSTCAKLEQLEESIRCSVKHISNKFVFIGELLRVIEEEKLYDVVYDLHGNYCKDVYKYAFLRFGLKKTSTFNLIGVSKEFAHFGELDKKWKEYSYSQLCEMLSMSDEEREKVTPNMTIKQIRELKNTLEHEKQIQTSEYEVDDDVEGSPIQTEKQNTTERLAALLEEGDEKHLWFNGHKDFSALARWLIENGVKLSR